MVEVDSGAALGEEEEGEVDEERISEEDSSEVDVPGAEEDVDVVKGAEVVSCVVERSEVAVDEASSMPLLVQCPVVYLEQQESVALTRSGSLICSGRVRRWH